jgi:hypothetical protein
LTRCFGAHDARDAAHGARPHRARPEGARHRQRAALRLSVAAARRGAAYALELLFALGTIDESGALTPLGAQCGALPLKPTLAVALLRAHERDVTEEMLSIVAMTSVDQVFADAGLGTVDAGSFAVLRGRPPVAAQRVHRVQRRTKSGNNWCAPASRARVIAAPRGAGAQPAALGAALGARRRTPDEAAVVGAASGDDDLSTRVRKALVVGCFPMRRVWERRLVQARFAAKIGCSFIRRRCCFADRPRGWCFKTSSLRRSSFCATSPPSSPSGSSSCRAVLRAQDAARRRAKRRVDVVSIGV